MDDYATWRPQAETDWTSEEIEKLRMDRDVWQGRFERLGQAGDTYFAELRDEVASLRAALDVTTAQVAHLQSILRDAIADDAEAVLTYTSTLGYRCESCGELERQHTPDCWVTRAVAALGADTTE